MLHLAVFSGSINCLPSLLFPKTSGILSVFSHICFFFFFPHICFYYCQSQVASQHFYGGVSPAQDFSPTFYFWPLWLVQMHQPFFDCAVTLDKHIPSNPGEGRWGKF